MSDLPSNNPYAGLRAVAASEAGARTVVVFDLTRARPAQGEHPAAFFRRMNDAVQAGNTDGIRTSIEVTEPTSTNW